MSGRAELKSRPYGLRNAGSSKCPVECMVLDVSRGGARLRITDSLVLPDEFDLLLSYKGKSQRVRLRWQRKNDIGVEFIKPPAEL
ncbi:MAG: hypothetical protein DI537_35420 [Stutzerimonas stutzeri]|nr:MAG: hypothetical protein DI537_35420 [Stutzerimonas stutzeri]